MKLGDTDVTGFAQRETEAFGPLILAIRQERRLAADRGARHAADHVGERPGLLSRSRPVIAEGPPEQVRSDPAVVASYLGTDERAINRSDATAPLPSTSTTPSAAAT